MRERRTRHFSLIGEPNVEVFNLDEQKSHIGEAELAGIQSVPALVTPIRKVLHINIGASLADVKASINCCSAFGCVAAIYENQKAIHKKLVVLS